MEEKIEGVIIKGWKVSQLVFIPLVLALVLCSSF